MDLNLAVCVFGSHGYFTDEQEHLSLRHLMATQEAMHDRSGESARGEARSTGPRTRRTGHRHSLRYCVTTSFVSHLYLKPNKANG